MPVGITGLIIAALIAGAISSLDADVNCISAVVVEDYYSRFKPKATDKQRLLVGKISVVVVGIGAILIALLYVSWGGEGVLGTLFGLYAIISAGIVGIFVLGLFSRRANWQGLYIGIAAKRIIRAAGIRKKQVAALDAYAICSRRSERRSLTAVKGNSFKYSLFHAKYRQAVFCV